MTVIDSLAQERTPLFPPRPADLPQSPTQRADSEHPAAEAAAEAMVRTVRTAHRLLGYGLLGWCLEVVFTGITDAIKQRDPTLRAKTYLWMLPIYGLGGLLLERLHAALAPIAPRPARALAYTGAIFATEYATGYALRRAVGRCPWDYTGHGLHVHGLVRLDYAPVWYACALLFEPAQRSLESAWKGLLAPTALAAIDRAI